MRFFLIFNDVLKNLMTDYMKKFPRVSDLEKRAYRRLPPFVGAYLFSGTGHNYARNQSVSDYQSVKLLRYLRGVLILTSQKNF